MTDLNLPEVLSALNTIEERCKEGSITRSDFDSMFPPYFKYFTAYGEDSEVYQLRYAMLQVISTAVSNGIFEASIGAYYEKRVDMEYRAGAQYGQGRNKVLMLYKAYYEAQSLPKENRMGHIRSYMSDARTINASIDMLYGFFQFISSDEFIQRLADNLAVYYAHYTTTGANESFGDARDTIHSFALLGKITDEQEVEFAAAIARKDPGALKDILDALDMGIAAPTENIGYTRRFTE